MKKYEATIFKSRRECFLQKVSQEDGDNRKVWWCELRIGRLPAMAIYGMAENRDELIEAVVDSIVACCFEMEEAEFIDAVLEDYLAVNNKAEAILGCEIASMSPTSRVLLGLSESVYD